MRSLSVQQAVVCLKAQQIVALPTDTIYGMSALVNKAMFMRLCALKNRPLTHSFVVLVDDIKRARWLLDSLNCADCKTLAVSERISWLLPAHSAPAWLKRDNTIALRVCPHPVIQAVCKALDAPIFSTSFNRHQELPCTSLETIATSPLARFVAGVVSEAQPCNQPSASTIRDMRTKRVIRT